MTLRELAHEGLGLHLGPLVRVRILLADVELVFLDQSLALPRDVGRTHVVETAKARDAARERKNVARPLGVVATRDVEGKIEADRRRAVDDLIDA